jgi:invasion protein IalB
MLIMASPPPRDIMPTRRPLSGRLHVGLVFAASLLGAAGAHADPATPPANRAAQVKAINGHNFENWTGKCEVSHDAKGKEKGLQCFIFQNLVLKSGGQRVLHVAIGYLPELKDPVALFTLPLGISLPPGVSLQVDDGEPMRFPVERCETGGCRAGIKLDEQFVKELENGTSAEVIFDDAARQPIKVPLSLKGLTAGLKALR